MRKETRRGGQRVVPKRYRYGEKGVGVSWREKEVGWMPDLKRMKSLVVGSSKCI